MYTSLSTEHDMCICMAMLEYIYMINQAVYKVEYIERCVWGLFIQDCECINIHCLVDSM